LAFASNGTHAALHAFIYPDAAQSDQWKKVQFGAQLRDHSL
jgi:hypothetical protein